jgi:glycosyltransferase involved in cell wall biosynthesis
MTRVLVVRGHVVTPWELRPWMELPDRFEVRCLLTGSNRYSPPSELRYTNVRSLRDLLPSGAVGDVLAQLVGDRYLGADDAFAWADIVHAEELGYWFSADAARRRRRGGFRLVQTVWETLPLLSSFRNRLARHHRTVVLAETDLFLAATARAALALRLEGVTDSRIRVCSPGIDVERFAQARPSTPPRAHVILSPGRLVWEKGHQDVIRAAALLHRGVVTSPTGAQLHPRVLVVGSGPEGGRLRAHAEELGIGPSVEIRSAPYDEMPSLFGAASAMVLASQAVATGQHHPFDRPHAFWEEQFGMVLAEAIASGLAIIATTSGAIPEVLAGASVPLIAPGDWVGLAQALADGPLDRSPGARVTYDPALIEQYSTSAAAARLTDAYDTLL